MRVWDHRVEIWNDGELPPSITPENIQDSHASYPRNKNLAFAFYKAGFIESWGRGWEKICNGFQAAGLPKPTIESKQGGVLVTFQRNNVNLKMTDGSQIGIHHDGVEHGVDKLTDRQRIIMGLIRQFVVEHVVDGVVEDGVEKLSARVIAQKVKSSARTIQRELSYLQEIGLIKHIGTDTKGYYKIIE